MALAWIARRVAADTRWEPDTDAYLRGLLRWCQSLAGSAEAPDVPRLHAGTPEFRCQVLVVGR